MAPGPPPVAPPAGEVEQAPAIPDRERADRAVTAITPLWPGWAAWLRVLFRFAPRLAPSLVRPLQRLALIHAGRFSIVDRLPSADEPGGTVPARPRLLVFQTDFDGQWRPYIEHLARVMPLQWWGIWLGARGFPGPLPVAKLLDYIERHDRRPAHHFTAHPDATVREIQAALELDARLTAFGERTRDLDDDAFALAFDRFLADVQRLL